MQGEEGHRFTLAIDQGQCHPLVRTGAHSLCHKLERSDGKEGHTFEQGFTLRKIFAEKHIASKILFQGAVSIKGLQSPKHKIEV